VYQKYPDDPSRIATIIRYHYLRSFPARLLLVVLPSSRVVFSSTCGKSNFQEFSSPRALNPLMKKKKTTRRITGGVSHTPMMKQQLAARPDPSRVLFVRAHLWSFFTCFEKRCVFLYGNRVGNLIFF
jgi:hypothetical protein